MSSKRFAIAAVLGLLVTSALFSFLWALINVHFESRGMQQAAKIEFTRLRRDSEIATIKRDKPKLEKPQAAPVMPQIAKAAVSRAGTETIAANLIAAPSVDTKIGMSGGLGFNVAGTDTEEMPLVRINPDYPPRAQSRGIQGWVVVQFTITPQGTVKDAKIVDGEPKGVFDDAAVNAVSRWKYNPKVQEGVPVERRGVQVKLTFKLTA
jgi:periplasmic protein TonB